MLCILSSFTLKDNFEVQNACQSAMYTATESLNDSDDHSSYSDSSFVSVTPPSVSPIVSDDDDNDDDTNDDDIANEGCEDTTEFDILVEPTQELLPLMLTEEPEPLSSIAQPQIYNYKLIGDNLDLTVKPRYSRVDGQKYRTSLHYFHYMCVRDRVNLSQLSIVKSNSCLNSPSKMALQILPSKECDDKLVDDLAMLVSRVIVLCMPFFQFGFADVVTWHQQHEFYKEMMSEKSEVVCVWYRASCNCYVSCVLPFSVGPSGSIASQ